MGRENVRIDTSLLYWYEFGLYADFADSVLGWLDVASQWLFCWVANNAGLGDYERPPCVFFMFPLCRIYDCHDSADIV